MEVCINGQKTLISGPIDIKQWLIQVGYDQHTVVVEHNGQIIDKEGLGQVLLQDGDSLEVLQFVGGG